MFDSISATFKQFIVQGKDWIGNAKNLVGFCLHYTDSTDAVIGHQQGHPISHHHSAIFKDFL